jgi:formylmethanofuran--tetrahydromethanopterin N-formyltransferase
MRIGSTEILDSHAEAFHARYSRLLITAIDEYWRDAAATALTGYATSIIGCDAEVGVEQLLDPDQTPDGRAGASVLLFAFSKNALAKAVANRVGQCVLTCPTTACFNGLAPRADSIPLGDYVRYFGDGHERQVANVTDHEPGIRPSALDPRHSTRWHIPVMDGEFVVDATAGVARGVAGGNFIVQAATVAGGLSAARRAADAVRGMQGVITLFPGGVCRSGSKVGSKYKNLVASTHEAYCPSLAGRVASRLVPGAACAYEIVINGVDRSAVESAMRKAIQAAAGPDVLAIGAADYGGKLGRVKIGLHSLFAEE